MEKDQIIAIYNEMSNLLDVNRKKVQEILTQIETFRMADVEISKTIRALRSYEDELPYLTNREPMGKVGVILPFNTPLYSLVLYTFGVLLAGNTVLVKPSSLSYDVTEALLNLLIKPIWNLPLRLFKPGKWFLQDLCLKEEKVQAISFTGQWNSVGVVYKNIPDNVRFIYSGSGYCPFIVLSNANVENAVENAVISRLWNSGQDCLASERFYVEEEVYEDFKDRLISALQQIRCGENNDPANDVGPLVSEDLVEYNINLMKESESTTRLLLSGNIHDRLITPFVFESDPHSPLHISEKYAPIFSLARISDRNTIVDLANELDFALAATVYGEDDRVMENLKFGHIAANSSILAIEDENAHVPFGGYKNSGIVEHRALNYKTSGPILYSVETSLSQSD